MPAARCQTCTTVEELYGSCEQVAPWLCSCEVGTAQSSQLQTKLVDIKPKRRIGRIIVPQFGAALRNAWLKAQR